jgi:hypothetical protein
LCAAVSLDVTAGVAYRVQSTVGSQGSLFGHDPGRRAPRLRSS